MRTRALVISVCSIWLGGVMAPSLSSLRAAPVPPGTPVLDPRDDRVQRKAIRGGAVDLSKESAELRELREFEHATFPRAGMQRAPEGESILGVVREAESEGRGGQLGPDAVPETLRSPRPRRLGQGGSEDRPPSMPWLSSLKLLDNLGLSASFVRFESHVLKYLEFYKEEKRGRSIMGAWLKRQGRYRGLIEEVLDRHKLPRFLLYVAMIESGYDPHDRSTAGAVGLWQFMPEGARIYGLRVDYWVDERKDPIRATEAAARYLGDLKARFGSWHLSLAAFNAGYGAVLRAMQKYNTNDYWELCRHEDGLPWETLLYVPKAIATALVGENRGLFGYDELVADPPMRFDLVPVKSSVTLAATARAVGVQQDELERLNPELRRGRTPPMPQGSTWPLRVPKGSAGKFLANYDGEKERYQTYVVRFGERVDEIAKSHRISVAELRRLNGVEDTTEVRAGVTLLLPAGKTAPVVPTVQAALPAQVGTQGPPPEVVLVAVPDKNLVVPSRKRVFYRTISGDTISGIARFFKVTPSELARWNNLDLDATLATKMVLDLWIDRDFDTSQVALVDPSRVRVVTTGSDEFFELVETLRGRRRLIYLCKAGDTLQKVAKRYGLTVADVERINRIGKNATLNPGQALTVYVQMDEKERQAALRKLVPLSPTSKEDGADKGGDRPPSVVVTPIEDGEDEGDAPEPASDKPVTKAGERPERTTLPRPPVPVALDEETR